MRSDYSDSPAQRILIDPFFSLRPDRLCILSSEASPSMASWLLTTYREQGIEGISTELILTSTEQGVIKEDHEGFKALHKAYYGEVSNTFTCSYLDGTPEVKENYFIWMKDDIPVKAFTCSYNFTQNSLLSLDGCGSITLCKANSAYKIFKAIIKKSIYCVNSEVEDYIVIATSHIPDITALSPTDPNYIKLPLVTKKTGEPGKTSGLNWGQREKRNPNEAYIHLPSKIAKSGFFPLNKQHFLVVTDDHHTLQLRVEQQGDKAITTPASNAQLGEYFRKRLGLANGAYVTAKDLKAYGRQDVSFYKIDDEQYFMDFSVSRREE